MYAGVLGERCVSADVNGKHAHNTTTCFHVYPLNALMTIEHSSCGWEGFSLVPSLSRALCCLQLQSMNESKRVQYAGLKKDQTIPLLSPFVHIAACPPTFPGGTIVRLPLCVSFRPTLRRAAPRVVMASSFDTTSFPHSNQRSNSSIAMCSACLVSFVTRDVSFSRCLIDSLTVFFSSIGMSSLCYSLPCNIDCRGRFHHATRCSNFERYQSNSSPT